MRAGAKPVNVIIVDRTEVNDRFIVVSRCLVSAEFDPHLPGVHWQHHSRVSRDPAGVFLRSLPSAEMSSDDDGIEPVNQGCPVAEASGWNPRRAIESI